PLRTTDPELKDRKSKLLKQMMDVHGEIEKENAAANAGGSTLKQLIEKRDQLDLQYKSLIEEIREKDPRLAAVQYPQPLSLAEAQQLLDNNTTLLEYFVGKNHSVLFAITNRDAETHELPGEDQLTAEVTRLRDVVQKPDPELEITEQ